MEKQRKMGFLAYTAFVFIGFIDLVIWDSDLLMQPF